ncbi:MAG: FecR family protein [Rhizobiaceae bacterium]
MSTYWKNSTQAALAATVIIGVQFCAAGAFAQTAAPIGETVAAATLVNAYGKNGKRVIAPKSPIFSDDRLQANSTGNAQIILVDKTKIVVGPGAEVRIDDFVFDTNKTFSKIVVKVSKGAIRFISGNSRSSAYKIKTPSGTIGIRG